MIYVILLLGFAVRLINLNQSLWLDEAITLQAIKSNTFGELVSKFAPGDFHPPLYYLFLKWWDGIFGYSEIASRIPSVLFGIVTVFLVFKIGEKLFSRRAGILAALFLAVNPLAVYYSQEARMYSLAMMLVASAIYFLLEKKWLAFAAAVVLSLYTDYLPALMLPVYFFITRYKKTFLKYFSVIILFMLPAVPLLLNQLGNGLSAAGTSWGDTLGRTNLKTLALLPVKFIFGRVSVENKYLYGLITGGVGIGYFLTLARNQEKRLWLWFLTPLFLAAVISFKVPVFTYFRFLFVLPAFVLLLSRAGKIAAGLVVIVSLLSLVYFNFNPKFWREDWRSAAQYADTINSRVVMPNLAQSAPLLYYKPDLQIMDQSNFNLNGAQTVYLVRYVQEIFDPKDLERQIIEANGYKLVEQKSFNNLLIWKYSL
ncbi:glycosyltransferase family 39 protein [Patescibacteria group bacterium]|nr:glycosyltransferase family 39 protein [Patescibacteria group bacterium]